MALDQDNRTLRLEAQDLLARLSAERIAGMATALNFTQETVRNELRRLAYWRPLAAVTALRREVRA